MNIWIQNVLRQKMLKLDKLKMNSGKYTKVEWEVKNDLINFSVKLPLNFKTIKISK